MKEEPINPGYVNQIFFLSGKQTCFNRSEFINSTVEDKGLRFDYQAQILDDFIKLGITIKYIRVAKETNSELDVITLFKSFRITKVAEIYPKDLLVVLEYSIDILNKDMMAEKNLPKGLPIAFPRPLYEAHTALLEQIAQDLNDKVQYP